MGRTDGGPTAPTLIKWQIADPHRRAQVTGVGPVRPLAREGNRAPAGLQVVAGPVDLGVPGHRVGRALRVRATGRDGGTSLIAGLLDRRRRVTAGTETVRSHRVGIARRGRHVRGVPAAQRAVQPLLVDLRERVPAEVDGPSRAVEMLGAEGLLVVEMNARCRNHGVRLPVEGRISSGVLGPRPTSHRRRLDLLPPWMNGSESMARSGDRGRPWLRSLDGVLGRFPETLQRLSARRHLMPRPTARRSSSRRWGRRLRPMTVIDSRRHPDSQAD